MDKRNIIRKVRLTPEEDALFKRKAARYKTVSAMVRDAVAQFDDTATRGKVKALREMTALYHKYEQDLRANELAIAQELTPQFFEQVLYPQVTQLQQLIIDIKREQHHIAKQLTRL